MRIRLLLVITFLMLGKTSFSQMTGGNVFLPGRFLEVGVAANGSFGAGPSPAGYNPYGGLVGTWSNIAMVYDYGHDGWTVGNPPLFGDYVYPGTPFEGWAMQVNGTRYDAFYNVGGAAGTSFTPTGLTGSNVSYTNAGGTLTGVWQGTCAGLSIRQSTRIDTGASWVIVTTMFINTTGAAIPGVYYWRTCDPDDDVTYSNSGGTTPTGFETTNQIIYQNTVAPPIVTKANVIDADNRVLVNSRGFVKDSNSYMALGTKDCRARAMIYSAWSTTPASGAANTLDKVYNGTSALGPTSLLGITIPGTQTYLKDTITTSDIAIGLIYNIGTIAAGDSAVISYAYIFGDGATTTFTGYNTLMNNAIDSAFPEPMLVVNGASIPPSGPAPAPTTDTFRACGTGLSALPVSIANASDKCWTWSQWNWSPTTGLASATGVNNSVNLLGIPSVITYTITGTDSNVNMYSCNQRVMYLTVITCGGATVNSPCVGGTLTFNAPGDSTGATYLWYGPAPSTTVVGTTQTFSIFPATANTAGVYHVVKTVSGISDTSFTTAVLNGVIASFTPVPDTLCINPMQSANMTNAPVVTSYTWSFGDGATDATAAPVHSYTAAGVYRVLLEVSDSLGCHDSISHTVYVLSTDIQSFHDTSLCLRAPLPLTNIVKINPAISGNFTYSWTESSPNLDNTTIQIPNVFGYGTFVDVLTATLQPWGCIAMDTITIRTVAGQSLTNVTSTTKIVYGSTIQLNADNELYYHWAPNDGSLDNPNINNPVAMPKVTTTYAVYGMDKNGCTDTAYITVIVDSTMHEYIPSAFTPNGDGLNDVFRPRGLNFQRLVEFRIYNRWGQQVFYTRKVDDGWDGTFNGVPQDAGVYTYQVIVSRPGSENHEGENVVYKGDVTLIR